MEEEMLVGMVSNNAAPNPQFGATAEEQAGYAMRLMQESPSNKQIFEDLFKCLQGAYQEVNATENKVINILKLLLANGASPDGHFINDLTPLMFTTELDLTQVVKLLIENNADTANI